MKSILGIKHNLKNECKRENTTFNNHEDELNVLVSNPMPKPENLSTELMKYFNKSESKSDNNKKVYWANK